MPAPKVFICYARSDNESAYPRERWLDRIREHLEPLVRQEVVDVFCDEVLELGEDWHGRIQSQLREARVVLLLVSRPFLASKYIASSEIPVLLQRAKKEGVRIIPIIVSPCAFDTIQFRFPDPRMGPERLKLSSLQSAGTPKESLCEVPYGRQERILTEVVEAVARHAAAPAPPTRTKGLTAGSVLPPAPGRPRQARTRRSPRASSAVPSAPKEPREWTNSLGMKFVPVAGTEVRFCIWQTRVQDYEVFARENPITDGLWRDPMFERVEVTPGPTYPVVNVSWDDSRRFCDWLTRKEQSTDRLGKWEYYRLPTDLEWSAAVGLHGETGSSPADRDGKVPDVYPWGRQWPPPPGSGNFADETARQAFPNITTIDDYRDGYATTSPVGEFLPSKDGLFDLAGNVWEWCEDWYDAYQKYRVLRGGAWRYDDPRALLSSCRRYCIPAGRSFNIGLRVVLVGAGSAR